jgi:hypothetical protein
MKTIIHKFPIQPMAGRDIINLPQGSHLLSAQLQRGIPFVWAEIIFDDKWPRRDYVIEKFETGVAMEYDPSRSFLGTLLLDNGAFVLHCYLKDP